jgi:hypothetical protein
VGDQHWQKVKSWMCLCRKVFSHNQKNWSYIEAAVIVIRQNPNVSEKTNHSRLLWSLPMMKSMEQTTRSKNAWRLIGEIQGM